MAKFNSIFTSPILTDDQRLGELKSKILATKRYRGAPEVGGGKRWFYTAVKNIRSCKRMQQASLLQLSREFDMASPYE